MPTQKQMEKLAVTPGQDLPAPSAVGPADALPPEYWRAILDDAVAEPRPAAYPIQALRLCDINRHLLRVSCRRCGRTVEIQMVDAARLYGPAAIWKNVGQRLLDATCQQRTGRHEEDGCWPSFE